ncbi:MAG: S-layer family protein [Xenococcaceae cyanobacterium MO_188.B29]|nr:S-layer family protein [Xenococcaceae cyanobacterium MO_188.B29]
MTSSIGTSSFESGRAGKIKLSGSSLYIQHGGTIISQTYSEGNSGNIEVTFSDEVNIAGGLIFDSNPLDDIITPDGTTTSVIGTTTLVVGDAGNVIIETEKLKLLDGGRVNSTASFTGNAGDIIVNANDSINIQGRFLGIDENNIRNRSQIISSAEAVDPGIAAFFNIPEDLQAQSGSVILNTNQLNVQDKGLISVINQGSGDAGNIEINAPNIYLNNQGDISASTLSGQGGNIILTTDQLQLIDESNISTSAEGLGDGGNITIDTDTLLAVENSDITATAVQGDGGNITITSGAILGIEERPLDPNTSDIDASSQFGQDGTVAISDPQVFIQDPIIAIREIDIEEPNEKLKNKCGNDTLDDRKQGLLVYTGRSGFSAEPDEFSDDEQYFPEPGYVAPPEEEPEDGDFPIWKEGDPLIEANAIRVDSNGEIYFVAELSPESAESLLCGARELEEEPAQN